MADFVFTSPGVKFKERDLSFVTRNVGITTLGLVGETQKGPAFEPVFVEDQGQFRDRFGSQSAKKLPNGKLQYELPYVANAYLEESSQLWVTRVLGLSGYDAGPSWSIITQANVDPTTIDFYCETPQIVDCLPYCDPADYKIIPYVVEFSGCSNSQGTISYDIIDFPSAF